MNWSIFFPSEIVHLFMSHYFEPRGKRLIYCPVCGNASYDGTRLPEDCDGCRRNRETAASVALAKEEVIVKPLRRLLKGKPKPASAGNSAQAVRTQNGSAKKAPPSRSPQFDFGILGGIFGLILTAIFYPGGGFPAFAAGGIAGLIIGAVFHKALQVILTIGVWGGIAYLIYIWFF